MYKSELDVLLQKGILTQKEYDEIFEEMSVNDKGYMTGGVPRTTGIVKYNFNGDILGKSPLQFLMEDVTVPYDTFGFNDLFNTYGLIVCGIGDRWVWYTEDNLTAYGRQQGCKPITEATEEEIWKMIAICERYWGMQYRRWYHEKCNESKISSVR